MRLRNHLRRFLRRAWPRSRPHAPPLLSQVSPAFAHEPESLLGQERRSGNVGAMPRWSLESRGWGGYVAGRVPLRDSWAEGRPVLDLVQEKRR